MLRPFRFLWKQLNGPQVTALFTAIFRWLQGQFNAQLDYLLHFSIDTANDAHLTLIGASLGIVRPIVEIADARFFLFTRDPLHNEEYGVSDLANPTVGGIFSDLDEDLRNKTRVLCPAAYYRRILQSYTKHSASHSSLGFIDNVLNDLWDGMHPGEASPIRYHFYTYRETANRTVGDIEVLIGPLEMWGDNDTALIWQGVLSGVFNALFNPEQIIDVNFN